MMTLDILAAGMGIFSFMVFLLVHFITFRWVRPERLLRSLLGCVIVTMLFPVLMMTVLYVFKALSASLLSWVIATVFSSLIMGLLCFFYVLCIFGPYETSVRMRLVREIQKGGLKGIKAGELSALYNAETILKVRLRRLVGSGDLIEKDGRYWIGRPGNFFFVFDAIAGVIKRWIGR